MALRFANENKQRRPALSYHTRYRESTAFIFVVSPIKQENQRLEDQLAATNQRIDDTKEFVGYVQEERELQQQRRQKENAPVWQRAKYWVFGFPEAD
jgi:hypothetical protein